MKRTIATMSGGMSLAAFLVLVHFLDILEGNNRVLIIFLMVTSFLAGTGIVFLCEIIAAIVDKE